MNFLLEGVKLMSYKFFVPNKAWMDFIRQPEYRYMSWLDLGCGMGHITKQLHAFNIECEGVDLIKRDGQYPHITYADAEYMPRAYDGYILARPSHGNFPYDMIRRFAPSSNSFLYVGLERNVEDDLADAQYELVAENVGEDGEHVWQVFGLDSTCIEWARLESYGNLDGGWWMVEGDRLVSEAGGWNTDFDKIVETKRFVHERQITSPGLAERSQRKESLDGWVDHLGKVWLTGYAQHDNFLFYCLRISTHRAEDMGWVKFWERESGKLHFWRQDGEDLTPDQIKALATFSPESFVHSDRDMADVLR